MKENTAKTLRMSLSTFGRILLAMLMCGFLYMSMSVIGVGLFGREVGYRIVEATESGQAELVEEHFYKPGEMPPEDKELKDNQRMDKITEIPHGTSVGLDVVTQILMVLLLGVFPYSSMWELGDKDNTAVRYRGKTPEILRGLKIGLLATCPFAVLYVLLVLAKFGVLPDAFLAVYRLSHVPFMPYINLVLGRGAMAAVEISFGQLIALLPTLLVVPVSAWLGYFLGYKQISVKEHLTYAKTKKTTSGKENGDTEI